MVFIELYGATEGSVNMNRGKAADDAVNTNESDSILNENKLIVGDLFYRKSLDNVGVLK